MSTDLVTIYYTDFILLTREKVIVFLYFFFLKKIGIFI